MDAEPEGLFGARGGDLFERGVMVSSLGRRGCAGLCGQQIVVGHAYDHEIGFSTASRDTW
jgi:hypothetical protein